MPITLNQQLVKAQSQTYKFEQVIIDAGLTDTVPQLSATVRFGVYNENGEKIDTVYLQYTGAEYNQFWNDFNAGKFLYDELNAKMNLGLIVPTTVESEFTN